MLGERNTESKPSGSLAREAERFLQELEARFENDPPDRIVDPRDDTHEKPHAAAV